MHLECHHVTWLVRDSQPVHASAAARVYTRVGSKKQGVVYSRAAAEQEWSRRRCLGGQVHVCTGFKVAGWE